MQTMAIYIDNNGDEIVIDALTREYLDFVAEM